MLSYRRLYFIYLFSCKRRTKCWLLLLLSNLASDGVNCAADSPCCRRGSVGRALFQPRLRLCEAGVTFRTSKRRLGDGESIGTYLPIQWETSPSCSQKGKKKKMKMASHVAPILQRNTGFDAILLPPATQHGGTVTAP